MHKINLGKVFDSDSNELYNKDLNQIRSLK